MKFVGALEGLRGYAALLMVVYHAWVLTGGPLLGGGRALISGGFLAVDLFFVLSAFVLCLPAATTGRFFWLWKDYALRRAARIVPAYYVALATALIFFHALAGPAADRRPPTAEGVLAHLTFLQVEARLIPGYDGTLGFRVDPVLWTMSVEVAFYVVLPLVALGFLRRPLLWLAVAFAATVALRALALGVADTGTADRLLSLPPMFAADFAAGMAGAGLYARGVRSTGWMAALAIAASIAVLWASGDATASAARIGARQSLWLAIATPAAFGALVLAAAAAPENWRRLADNHVARWLGKVSFGVFLFHFMVMLFCLNTLGFERGTNADFLKLLIAGVAGSVLVGWASWLLVEQPARRRVRQAQLTYAAR